MFNISGIDLSIFLEEINTIKAALKTSEIKIKLVLRIVS